MPTAFPYPCPRQPRSLVVFLLCLLALGVGSSRAWATQLEEKRSCIQSVDGYAYLSEKLTLAEMRQAAVANAKEQALSNARTYITSKTEVENFTLKSDLVQLQAEGSVVVLELQDLGIEDNSRYHVRIKAEVFYEIAAPQGQAGAAKALDKTLTVRVWSSQNSYRAGEKIVINIQGNRDFYARIVNISPDGAITQLLPNAMRGEAFFRGNTLYTIPGPGDQFDLTVSPPFGQETVVVYASLVELGQVPLQPAQGGLGTYSGDQKSLALATRAITVTPTAKAATAVGPAIIDFYEARLQLDTRQ